MRFSLLAVTFFATTLWAQEQEYRFETRVEAVAVDVAVTRENRPVAGLTAEDFEVRDNGVLQEVEQVQVETAPVNAVLILDNSESVAGKKLMKLRAAVRDFVAGLRENDRAALLAFSHDIQLLQDLTADPSLVLHALNKTSARGGTALFEALYAGLMLAEPPVTRPIVVLFSDGEDTVSRVSEAEIFDVVRESNAVVYVVRSLPSIRGITPLDRGFDRYRRAQIGRDKMLRQITDSTGGRFWPIETVSNIKQEFLRVLEEIKSRYLLTYSPKGIEKEGWHSLEVKLKNHTGDVRARRGYYLSSRND